MIKNSFSAVDMNQIKFSVITDMKYRQTVTKKTLYYCYGITTALQIVCMKTLDQQQAEKIQNGQYYILRKFYQSSDGIQTTITLYTDTKIFQTSQFDYNIQQYNAFFRPEIVNLNQVFHMNLGRRISVHGIVIDKSTYSKDSMCTRTDIILKADNMDDYITVKAWDLNCDIIETIQNGQLVTLYALIITKYNDVLDLSMSN